MIQRGDVILVEIPYAMNGGQKIRPAVVIQADYLNKKLGSSLVAAITTNLKHVASEPSQFLIDPATPDGQSSNLLHPSAVKCENLFTVSQQRVKHVLGHLSPPLIDRLHDSLKAALAL
jgi:mRNA-degrading endonuclease toxin of MazEF toxin-antitoxin module